MTFILGLTGSIGTGKSTTAQMFRDFGIPVWDADATVHAMYQPGGRAVAAVAALCPEAERNGGIDRAILKQWLAGDPDGFRKLENLVHPLVAADRKQFINHCKKTGHPLVVVDIPLLFETGAETYCNATLLVSAHPEEQRRRVLSRPGMTPEHFEQILARQMPDAEKRRRATYVIETISLEQTRSEIKALIEKLHEGQQY